MDWFLYKYTTFEKKQRIKSPFVNPVGASDYINKERLLVEFFDIDLDEAERERESILKSL